MNELFKEKQVSETPTFFTEEQKNYFETRSEELKKQADVNFSRQQEQRDIKLSILREDTAEYGQVYRDQQILAKYERYRKNRIYEIDSNPKYSESKKNKEKKKLEKNRDKKISSFAEEVDVPEMISEKRVQEAEENLKTFTEVEVSHEVETEKAKAMFLPEERDVFKTDRHINIMLFHDNLETTHEKNKKIVKGYLSEDLEERKEFVLDIYNTINTYPTDLFNFASPAAFKEKYAEMYGASQKIMTYRSVLSGEKFLDIQAQLKETNPELAQAFEDKMEFFSKCVKQVGLYKNYLSSTNDYGASDALVSQVEKSEGDLSRFEYRSSLKEESENSGIRLGETKYEKRLEIKNTEREKYNTAKARYEAAIKALHDAPQEPEGEYASPALTQLKMEAEAAKKEFQKISGTYIPKYGLDMRMPETEEVAFTEKEKALSEPIAEFKKAEASYNQQIQKYNEAIARPNALLKDSYSREDLNPLFYDALMEEYGNCLGKMGIEEKVNLTSNYKAFFEAEQKMRKLINPADLGEPSCPPEIPQEYKLSEKELEFYKLTIHTYKIEGETETIGEPLFRSFSSFGSFADTQKAVTKEELKQMLRNLGAGSNFRDSTDAEESAQIREKNLAGLATYKKILSTHYLDMFKKYGEVDKMSFEERLKRMEEFSSAFGNMQVDNHWVDRYPELFNAPEDKLLVDVIHYYNLNSAFMVLSEQNLQGMGMEAYKQMDELTRRDFMKGNDFQKAKKALFK